ncbi:MAG: hypothetical protein NTX25_14870 [Proteobacteria bacterium]|nr:hypothetical protein [Pseudomonadota bacterium]
MKLDIWPIFLILSTLSSVSCNKNLANKSQQSSQDASSSNVLPKRTLCQAIDNRVSAETLEKVETQLVDTPEFPQLLSQTGCVDPENPQTPAANLIPYSIQAGLWSDGADKERFFAIPKDKKIQLAADGRFDLPNGSVTMKLFRIHGQPVETRFYMRESDGRWSGYSYEWQDDGKDAVLLNKAKEKIIGGQTWTFPSRSTCKQCHSLASGISLGLELAQLNRPMPTGAGLSSINQL